MFKDLGLLLPIRSNHTEIDLWAMFKDLGLQVSLEELITPIDLLNDPFSVCHQLDGFQSEKLNLHISKRARVLRLPTTRPLISSHTTVILN